MNNKRRVFVNYGISILIILGVFIIGYFVGISHKTELEKVSGLSSKETSVTTDASFEPFWKAWNVLNEKSIYAKKKSDQDRVWGAISGLASSLDDPYTVFFNPQENKLFKDEIQGSFGGIGAEVGMKDKIITIISPMKGTPSFNSGLKAGDKIIKIDNTSTNEMSVDKAISLIRGPKGTTVTLTILRSGENKTREYKIVRDTIDIPTIETEYRDGVFIIRLFSFSENSVTLFKKALDEFRNTGSNKLIIDLRGNPGGYLEAAVGIGSYFIDEGKVIVSEDFGDKAEMQIYRSLGPRLFNNDLKLIVLVDGGSASASEILAGALKEHGIGKLLGEQTYGKGSVQELVNITPDTSLKVTVARWLTPNGVSISEKGLEPDIKIPLSVSDIEKKNDVQLGEALRILKDKN